MLNRIMRKLIRKRTYIRLAKNMLIALFSILIFFGILELALFMLGIEDLDDSNKVNCCSYENIFPVCHSKASTNKGSQYNVFVFGESSVWNLKNYEEEVNQKISEEFKNDEIRPNIKFAGLATYGTLRLFPYFVSIVQCNSPKMMILYLGNNEFEDQRILEMSIEEKGKLLHELNIFMGRFRFYRAYKKVILKLGEKSVALSLLKKRLFPRSSRYTIKPYVYYWGYLKTEEEKEAVAGKFEENLGKMVRYAKDNNVTIILSTIPINLEYPPGGSLNFFEKSDPYLHTVPRISYWKTQKYRKTELLDKLIAGLDKIKQGDLEQARKIYVSLGKSVGKHDPFIEYYLGIYYLKKGNNTLAKIHLRNARDLDADPHSAISSINNNIRKVAYENNVTLIDFEEILTEKSSNGILGKNLFSDKVHLNVIGEHIWIDTFNEVMINAINESS